MRGVVFLGERRLEVREFPDPAPGPGEVVIEIKASGMCGSDLKFYRPSRAEATRALGLGGDGEPNIAGHEPCGVVVARGEGVTREQAPDGARVMVHHYKGCGVCEDCRVGWQQLCPEGSIVYGATGDGAHADYMKAPASTLVPLPPELSFETGAAIACGTGTAFGALKRVNLTGSDTIAIFGQGPVGLSATQFANAMGGPGHRPRHGRGAPRAREGARCGRDRRSREQRSGGGHQGPDRRARRRHRDRLLGQRGGASRRDPIDPDLGHGGPRRRGRHDDRQRLPGAHPQAAHHRRVVDVQRLRTGRLRPFRRRARHRRGPPLHPALLQPGRGGGGLPALRHPDHRQGRLPAPGACAAENDATE